MPLAGEGLAVSDNDVHVCDQILKSLLSVSLKKGSCLSCVMCFYFQNLHNHLSSHILLAHRTLFQTVYLDLIHNGGNVLK